MGIKLLITSKKGYPVAYLYDVPSASFRVRSDMVRRLKWEGDKLQVPIDYWFQFVELNKERFGLEYVGDIEIDKNSIPYYGFSMYNGNGVYRTSLTQGFVDKFFNYDCDRIIRFEPNTENHTNCLGMRLAEFETVIYDASYCSVKIDEDTTKEECIAILQGCHPESTAAKALKAHMEALKVSDLEVELIEKKVIEYETELNDLFVRYDQLIKDFKSKLPQYAFDCGFTMVSTIDPEMKKNYQILVSKGKRDTLYVQVDFPDDYFCSSNSYEILKYLKDISKNNIVDTISVSRVLD